MLGLIGDARMAGAIWSLARQFLRTAEAKFRLGRIADRPMAHRLAQDGKTLRRYWTAACQTCALKAQCTPGKERRISRWEHETVLETVQDRLDRNPDKMRVRRQTVEHPA
jgi:hypothetical protein